MKIALTFLLFISLSSISITTQAGNDVLGLIRFMTSLKGQMSPKDQGLKLISEKKGRYYITGKLEKIKDKIEGVECEFKNKYFSAAKSQKLILDYSKTRTHHKVLKFKYNDEKALRKDYTEALEFLKTRYKYYGRMQKQEFAEIRDSATRISERIEKNITIVGYRLAKAKSQMNTYFIEISYELETNELVVKLIDYKTVK